jgi:hypothetical protein
VLKMERRLQRQNNVLQSERKNNRNATLSMLNILYNCPKEARGQFHKRPHQNSRGSLVQLVCKRLLRLRRPLCQHH